MQRGGDSLLESHVPTNLRKSLSSQDPPRFAKVPGFCPICNKGTLEARNPTHIPSRGFVGLGSMNKGNLCSLQVAAITHQRGSFSDVGLQRKSWMPDNLFSYITVRTYANSFITTERKKTQNPEFLIRSNQIPLLNVLFSFTEVEFTTLIWIIGHLGRKRKDCFLCMGGR